MSDAADPERAPGPLDREPSLARPLAGDERQRPAIRLEQPEAGISATDPWPNGGTSRGSPDLPNTPSARSTGAALRPSNPIAARSSDASRTVIPANRRASTCRRSRSRAPVSGSDEHDHASRSIPAPPRAGRRRHAAWHDCGTNEPRSQRGQPCRRSLEHELRELGAVDQSDGPDAHRELGRGRSEVHRHWPAVAGRMHRTRPAQHHIERLDRAVRSVGSGRHRHAAEGTSGRQGPPCPLGVNHLSDREVRATELITALESP